MAQESGYITPALDADSGSEYCPSDQPRAQSKPKPKPRRGNRKKKAASPPTSPDSDGVAHIKEEPSASAPLTPTEFPFPADQMNTFSNHQQLQTNAFNQQNFFNPNIGSQSAHPSVFQNAQGNNAGGFVPDCQFGGLQFPGFWDPCLPVQPIADAKNEDHMAMFNPAMVGYGADTEADAFALEIMAFECDMDLMLGGRKALVPSDFAPEIKLEPAMENPFAPIRDRESTVASERSDSKTKNGSKINTNASSIPLICLLCDKKPKFSDVSHLLTHVSSKGHLSRRFQLDLKAKSDPEVFQQLQEYRDWVGEHGIEDLLTTRQEAKDQKKETQLRRQKGTGKDKKSRRSSTARETFKAEASDSPRMPHSHLNPLNQNWKRDDTFDYVYQTPSTKRTRSEYPEPDTPHLPSAPKDEPVEIVTQGGSRTPTLKGIVFAGMGIFDAGTPEMKRMRNQKKDPSVVENMMLVSESISKTETVWGSTMQSVERTRSVYDTPTDPGDEFGPDDDDEPPAKKPRAPRAAPKYKPRSKAKAKPRPEESPQPTGPTTQRLTRSAARAMSLKRVSDQIARGGKQRGQRAAKNTLKVEEEQDWPSDDDMGLPQRRRGLSVFQESAMDNSSLGVNMHRGRGHGAQGFDANPFVSQQLAHPLRTAMQGLPPNRPLSSMHDRQDSQQFNLLDKENNRNVFSMQHNTNTSMLPRYYQTAPTMQSDAGYNPLLLQPADSFNQVYGTGFDASKTSNSPFQSLNGFGYNGTHTGMGGLNGGLLTGLNSNLGNAPTNNVHNNMTNGMNSGVANGLHGGINANITHGLDNGTNAVNQYQPDPQYLAANNSGQSNDFDVQ